MISKENNQQKRNINPYFDYFSKICCQRKQFTSFDQFTNGLIFYDVLCTLKSFQKLDSLNLDEPSNNCMHKLSNLKILKEAIDNYWFVVLQSPISNRQIDLIELSKNSNEKEYQKFAGLVVNTLLKSDEKQRFIQIMLKTQTKTQQFFMSILQTSKIAKKTEQSDRISTQKIIYDKLLQLQNENERIISIVEQLSSQKEELISRQLKLENELEQKNKQIQNLKWHIFQLQNQKHHPTNLQHKLQEKQHIAYREQIQLLQTQLLQTKKTNQQIRKKNTQYQINEQSYIKSIKMLRSQILVINQQKNAQIQSNQFLSNKIRALKHQIKQTQQLINSLTNEKQQYLSKSDQSEINLMKIHKQLQEKQKLIEQLQVNINMLNENKYFQGLQVLKNPIAQRSSIKQQCSKSSLTFSKQNSLTWLINQNKKTIESQKQQIERLKIHEMQNKKLTSIINHMNKYRGQQTEILVKCLYKMRLKMLDKTLKQTTNVHNNRGNFSDQCLK